jgi:glyoxylase-like metal-dependent hydrolase (beta-lactamase superfamily II)
MPHEVMKDIYLIRVPLPGNPLKNLNTYLIKGAERSLLIDTGFNIDSCHEALIEGIAALGVSLDDLDIFLTHVHSDHTGLIGRLKTEKNRIFISSTDLLVLDRFRSALRWKDIEEQSIKYGFSEEEIRENRSTNPFKNYLPPKDLEIEPIEEGFIFKIAGYNLVAISTPGHTPGHMVLYDEAFGILIAGDHIIFDISPNITRWSELQDSLGDYLNSLDKIFRLHVRTTLSAHRNPNGDVRERITELKEHHMLRLDEALAIIKTEPGLTTYEIAARMTWSIRAKNWIEFPLTQKWFAVGEAGAHLDHLIQDGLIEEYEENGKLKYK